MLQADPRASPETVEYVISAEGNLDPVHWDITKNQQPQQWKDKKNIQLPVAKDSTESFAATGVSQELSRSRDACRGSFCIHISILGGDGNAVNRQIL